METQPAGGDAGAGRYAPAPAGLAAGTSPGAAAKRPGADRPHQEVCGPGEQHLPAVARDQQPSDPVHGRTDIIAPAGLRLSGVQRDPCPQRRLGCGGCGGICQRRELLLEGQRSAQGIGRMSEDGADLIAPLFEDQAMVSPHGGPQPADMPRQSAAHAVVDRSQDGTLASMSVNRKVTMPAGSPRIACLRSPRRWRVAAVGVWHVGHSGPICLLWIRIRPSPPDSPATGSFPCHRRSAASTRGGTITHDGGLHRMNSKRS